MRISRLKLVNFRNYSSAAVEFSPGLNIIHGANAQGKTNLLEAVFVCTFARSHRSATDERLIFHGAEGFYLGLDVGYARGTSSLIEVKCRSAGGKKQVLVDGKGLKRMGDLMGVLNAVLFAPESLDIVKGVPLERRRFLDMAISQLYPAYFFELQKYNSTHKQRNAHLNAEGLTKSSAQLAMWNAQLAAAGGSIMRRRHDFMDGLSGIAAKLHEAISGGHERLELKYAPSITADADKSAADTFLQALDDGFAQDQQRGTTRKGPHRDDIAIIVNGTDVRYFGSQGQQRTAALAMKLSEIEIIKQLRGDTPVLLLDDVFSELDGLRKVSLLKAIHECQCILTCTSLDGLSGTDMRVFECANGTLSAQ